MKTLPPTSLLSCVTLAARPGNWDPADHRGVGLGHTQNGSGDRTTFTLREGSLLRAFRVCTPGLVSTATLPSVIRGGYDNNNNNNHNENNSNNSSSNNNNNSNNINNHKSSNNNNNNSSNSSRQRAHNNNSNSSTT